jgi:integrase/recombinase XerC
MAELMRHAEENAAIANRFHGWTRPAGSRRARRRRRDAARRGRRPESSFTCRRPRCACGTWRPTRRRLVRKRRLRRRAPVRQQPARALLRPEPRFRSGALAGRRRRRCARPCSAAARRRNKHAFGLLVLGSPDPERFSAADGDRLPGPHRRNRQRRAGRRCAPEPDPMDTPAADDWTGRYLAELRTQRQLSPTPSPPTARDLAELAAWPAAPTGPLTHADIRRFAAGCTPRPEPRSIARKLSAGAAFQLAGAPDGAGRQPGRRRARAAPRQAPAQGAGGRRRRAPDAPRTATAIRNRPSCATAPCSSCCIRAACGCPNWPAWTWLRAAGWRAARSAGWTRRPAKCRHRQGQQDAPGAGRRPPRWPRWRPGWRCAPASDGSNALFLSARGTRISRAWSSCA